MEEEGKQLTLRVEEGEQVGKDKQQERGRVEEGMVIFRRQGEVVESQCQRGEEEEAQVEGKVWDEN